MREFLACLLFGMCAAVMAGTPAPPDPVLEKRVMALSEELRCLVCQNQSIADSNAELAVDLRGQVRAMLRRGMTDQQVIDFVVQRYGNFVLYRPPVRSTTWLLWFGPLLLLVAGLLTLALQLARPRVRQTPMAPDELLRATKLLDDKDGVR